MAPSGIEGQARKRYAALLLLDGWLGMEGAQPLVVPVFPGCQQVPSDIDVLDFSRVFRQLPLRYGGPSFRAVILGLNSLTQMGARLSGLPRYKAFVEGDALAGG